MAPTPRRPHRARLSRNAGPLVAALAVLSGCAGAFGPGDTPLDDTSWVAEEVAGRTISGPPMPRLAIGRGGAYGATGGCNRFSGTAEIGAGMIRFPPTSAGSLIACPEEVEQKERTFLGALAAAEGFSQGPTSLTFLDAGGTVVARFRSAF